jgi:hypothetical protein
MPEIELAVRGLGWKPDPTGFSDAIESVSAVIMRSKFGAAPLPRKWNDLSRFAYFRDQLDTSACTGFSLSGCLWVRLRALGFTPEIFSVMFPYAVGRALGTRPKLSLIDDGAYPFLVMSGGQRYGFLPEPEMPFNPKRINERPKVDDFQKASQFRLSHVRRIDSLKLRIEYMKRSIHKGIPVWGGLQVGSEFMRFQAGNKPVGVEFANTGGHMVYFTGWDDDRRCFEMPNSWGKNVGRNGFWDISYDKIEHESSSDFYSIDVTDVKMSASEIDTWQARLERALDDAGISGGFRA